MKAIDRFLLRHEVDVGKSLGLLVLVEAISAFYGIVGHAFIGRADVNLGAPIGLIIGIALWRHASWARTLTIVISWLVAGLLAVLLLGAPFMTTVNITLNLGSVSVKNPPLWQISASALLLAPAAWFILAVLYSNKAATEFEKSKM